jgi:two-component system invasion response regulator UvrY
MFFSYIRVSISPYPFTDAKKMGKMTDLIRTLAIADDHLIFRQAISRYLNLLGFHVAMEAANGMELLRLLEGSSRLPDACLLDMEMPLMDGVATTRVLRVRYPDIKVIGLTLSQDNSKRQSLMQAGASDVFFKGADEAELKEALFQILS